MKFFKELMLASAVILLLSACGGGGGGGGGAGGDTTGGTGGDADINTSDFDGVWYSPCFNNIHDFSARQKITINGNSLISELESHAAAPAQTLGCPLSGNDIIGADITATLDYGSETTQSGCINSKGVRANLTLVKNETSGELIDTQPEMSNSIQLLTGRGNDFLPASTVICLKPNGNLLFAGYEYTGNGNSTVIVAPIIDPPVVDTQVKWQLNDYKYKAGSSSSTTGPDNKIRSLVVSTVGSDTTSYGDYSGSVVTIGHTLQGAGTYSLGNTTFMSEDDYSHKRMTLSVTVGTATSAPSAIYEAVSGKAIVTVDNKGRYHFYIKSPIQLKKFTMSSEIPNAPDTMRFTANNLYDFSENQ